MTKSSIKVHNVWSRRIGIQSVRPEKKYVGMVVWPKSEYKIHEAKWLVYQCKWTKIKKGLLFQRPERLTQKAYVSLWGRGEWGGDLRISITYHPYKETNEKNKDVEMPWDIAIVYERFLIIVQREFKSFWGSEVFCNVRWIRLLNSPFHTFWNLRGKPDLSLAKFMLPTIQYL